MTKTPLEEKLRRIIEASGPMSIADYMAHCLGDPEHGYYTTRDPFGVHGDFITAPEVSQMFGEIIGAWLIETWRLIEGPSPVSLVELGPGRGTLMADILRVAAKAPAFAKAIQVHLIETSPALKARQAETLASSGRDIRWHDSFAGVPRGNPILAVANEFFDALPVRQYVRVERVWRERVVGIDANGGLAFGIGAGTFDIKETGHECGALVPPLSLTTGEEPVAVLEIRPAADALMGEIARWIVEDNGAGLVIDYGYDGPAFGDTLQAVRGHDYSNPLTSPGEADLTAHVDFSALARSARAEGAAVHGPIGQREFLLSLGLAERAGRLGASADEETRAKLRSAVERLAGADQMGTLFRALALIRPGIAAPPFDRKI